MSKGPGRIQRAILALIAATPDGAWSYGKLCRLIYPETPREPTRAQRHAVGRALNRMTLPGTWTTGYNDSQFWLFDACNFASVRESRRRWNEAHFKPGGWLFEQVEKAKRFRDAAPRIRIEMQIADAQTQMAMLKMAGALSGDAANAAAERIKELQKRKAELEPPCPARAP